MKSILISLFLIVSANLTAQEKLLTNSNAVKSIDGIVNEMLKIISGEEGKVRDWQAFRNLFLPTASFSILNQDPDFPQAVETISLDDFIELMHDEYYQKGFIEYETGKVVNEFNGIAQVFQSFYGKDSENVEGRGINSYQLVNFDNRWWIANMLWTGTSEGAEIPKKYLKNGRH